MCKFLFKINKKCFSVAVETFALYIVFFTIFLEDETVSRLLFYNNAKVQRAGRFVVRKMGQIGQDNLPLQLHIFNLFPSSSWFSVMCCSMNWKEHND